MWVLDASAVQHGIESTTRFRPKQKAKRTSKETTLIRGSQIERAPNELYAAGVLYNGADMSAEWARSIGCGAQSQFKSSATSARLPDFQPHYHLALGEPDHAQKSLLSRGQQVEPSGLCQAWVKEDGLGKIVHANSARLQPGGLV